MENANVATQESEIPMLQAAPIEAMPADDYALLEEVLSTTTTADEDLPEYRNLRLGSCSIQDNGSLLENAARPDIRPSPSLRPAEVAALLGVTEQALMTWRSTRLGPRYIACRKAGIRYRAADVAYLVRAKTAGQRALRQSRRWL